MIKQFFLLLCCFLSNLSFGQWIYEITADSDVIGVGHYSEVDDVSGLFYQKLVNSIDEDSSETFLFKLDVSHDVVMHLRDTVVGRELLMTYMDNKISETYLDFLIKMFNNANSVAEIECIGDINLLTLSTFNQLAINTRNEELKSFIDNIPSSENGLHPDSIISYFDTFDSNELGMRDLDFEVFKSIVYDEMIGSNLTDVIQGYLLKMYDHILILSNNESIKKMDSFCDLAYSKRLYLVTQELTYISKKPRKVKLNCKCHKVEHHGLSQITDATEVKVALNYFDGCKSYIFDMGEFLYYW